jgi:hypothetical protein
VLRIHWPCDTFGELGRQRQSAILVALAPHLDGAPLEIEVAEPQAGQLDAAQPEALGDRDGHLVEQWVAASASELAQHGGLLDRDGAPVRLGARRLAQPQGHVGRGVALLDQVAPQVPERADGVLLRRAPTAASFVAPAGGQHVLGDQVGQIPRRDRARVAVAVIGDQPAGPGPVGVLGALGHQRQGAGLVQLDCLGERYVWHDSDAGGGGAVGPQAQEVEDPTDRRRVAFAVGGGEDVERERWVGEGVDAAGQFDPLDHPDDRLQRPSELAQAGQFGAGPPA